MRGMKSQKEIGCIQAFTDLEERKKKKKKRITERATIDYNVYILSLVDPNHRLYCRHTLCQRTIPMLRSTSIEKQVTCIEQSLFLLKSLKKRVVCLGGGEEERKDTKIRENAIA